jgi:hypothetical protein
MSSGNHFPITGVNMIAVATEKLYTPEEVGKLFGKEPSTVINWIRGGKLQRTKVGGTLFIKESDLLAMLEGTE